MCRFLAEHRRPVESVYSWPLLSQQQSRYLTGRLLGAGTALGIVHGGILKRTDFCVKVTGSTVGFAFDLRRLPLRSGNVAVFLGPVRRFGDAQRNVRRFDRTVNLRCGFSGMAVG